MSRRPRRVAMLASTDVGAGAIDALEAQGRRSALVVHLDQPNDPVTRGVAAGRWRMPERFMTWAQFAAALSSGHPRQPLHTAPHAGLPDVPPDRSDASPSAMPPVDLAVLAWWPHIVGPDVLAWPAEGVLNFHPSLLPANRGKHPNFWSIVEGTPFGVTIHWALERVDAGAVAFAQPIATDWTDTGGSLHAKARAAIVDLFAASAPAIFDGAIPRVEQGPGPRARRGSELEPACCIDLDAPTTARAVLNLLRARTYPPHPGCSFEDHGRRFRVRVSIEADHPGPGPGTSSGSGLAPRPTPGPDSPNAR